MATYECLQCGTRREVDDRQVAAHERVCPVCGGPLRDLALPQE